MTRGVLTIGVAVAGAALVLSLAAIPLRQARQSFADAVAARDRILRLVADVEEASARPPTVTVRGAAEDALPAQVGAVLLAAGVSESTFLRASLVSDVVVDGVAPDVAANAGDGSVYRHQTASVQLRGVTVGELGRFLLAWRERHPTWTPIRLELTTIAQAGRAGREGRYQVALTVANTYLGEAGV